METFNIETNFAISLTYNRIYDVWEPFIEHFDEKVCLVVYFSKKIDICDFLLLGSCLHFTPPPQLVLVFLGFS
jgi:hypothetical protein